MEKIYRAKTKAELERDPILYFDKDGNCIHKGLSAVGHALSKMDARQVGRFPEGKSRDKFALDIYFWAPWMMIEIPGPPYKTAMETMEIIRTCDHQWVATQLLFSMVHDCKLCGAKKEEL